MSQKRPSTWGNPELRHQMQMSAPAIEQIESLLFSWLSPASFKPLRTVKGEKKLRDSEALLRLRSISESSSVSADRLLTLPVMMAVVLSLVYRRIPGLSEVLRVLEQEGLLWVEPLKVSKQALSKRLGSLPAQLMAQVFEQVIDRMRSLPNQLACTERLGVSTPKL